MTKGDRDDAHEHAERLRREIEEALHGKAAPRSPREFVAEQMRRLEEEDAKDEEDGGERDTPGEPPAA
jgi:hypothetical protein